MELQGKVHQILETETKGEKNFKTKRIIIDRSTEYQGVRRENYTEVQFSAANVEIVENLQLKPGDVLKCNFDINGRFYPKNGETKYFQTVTAWNPTVISRS